MHRPEIQAEANAETAGILEENGYATRFPVRTGRGGNIRTSRGSGKTPEGGGVDWMEQSLEGDEKLERFCRHCRRLLAGELRGTWNITRRTDGKIGTVYSFEFEGETYMYGWDDGRHRIDFHALPVSRDDVITITEDRYMVRSDFTNHGRADEGIGDPGEVPKSIRKEAEDLAELDSRSGATKKRSLKETEKCRDFTTTMSENDGSTIKVTKWS